MTPRHYSPAISADDSVATCPVTVDVLQHSGEWIAMFIVAVHAQWTGARGHFYLQNEGLNAPARDCAYGAEIQP